MLILVVHNSSHHADNVLRLGEEITKTDPHMSLAVLCESKDLEKVKKQITNPETKILVLGQYENNNKLLAKKPIKNNNNFLATTFLKLFCFYVEIKKKFKGKSRLTDAAFKIIEYNSIACLLREKRVEQHFKTQVRDVHRLFDTLSPDIVLSWGDRHTDIEAPALIAAKQRNIKILLPYVTFSSFRGLLWSRRLYGEPKRWTPFSVYRFAANFTLSKMIREGYFHQEPHVLFSLRKLGGLSSNPWSIGCGLSDIVCVDSEITSKRYSSEGVPREKLRLVGSPEFDVLYRGVELKSALRKHIVEKYDLNIENKIIVIALPQFAEQGVLSWDEHWSEIRYILGQLARIGLSIIVSLHPRVEYKKYIFLEKEFKVCLSVEPLKNILPIANAFVAVNSSTLVWAILCGIKPFMLDFYSLDSSDFVKFKSISVLQKRENIYDGLVVGLMEETDFTDDWELLSRNRVFDGKVINRYSQLIRGLAVNNKKKTFSIANGDVVG